MFVYIHCRADEKKFSARMMCAVLPVSESSFYKWKRNRGKVKAWQKLLAEMHRILDEDEENKNYGVRRMQIALEQRGIKRSLSTVRRVMARGNLLLPCKDGKLYVSPLLDCYNGEIIALAMDTNMKKELCIKTITEAYKNFDIKDGAIIHSDGGSQYTSSEYKKRLGQLHAVQSMSGVGKCSLKCNS